MSTKKPRKKPVPMPMHRRPESDPAPGFGVRDAEPPTDVTDGGSLGVPRQPAGADWKEILEGKLKLLPKQPGVYIFRDERGRVIYVGKAKVLRDRVRSYFRGPEPDDSRLHTLRQRIRNLDYVALSSEGEALILEAQLIKQYAPRFNIQLKDDKKYPYLKVTVDSPFPALFLTRHVVPDGSRYFGPFIKVKDLRHTLKVLRSVFQLRNCSDQRLARDDRECLQFHIGRCTAPCTHRVNESEYKQQVDPLIGFLSGRGTEALKRLGTRMKSAAAQFRFEEAARLRDGIQTLERLMEDQRMTPPVETEADALGLAIRADQACALFLHVREGKILGKSHQMLTGVQGAAEPDLIGRLLLALFLDAPRVPARILTPVDPTNGPEIAEILSERSGHKVQIETRLRGELKKLLDLAKENAHLQLEEEQLLSAQKRERVARSVYELQEVLDLPMPPYRIEGYDISNFQGAYPVASIVSFSDGKPLKSGYRRLRMDAIPGPDDFAMIGEALRRRLQRIETRGELPPDLLLIDGGRGQVGRAREVLEEMGYAHLPLVGLAKREEEIVFPHGGPVLRLPRSSQALQLLQRVRDEAHRFAITYHRTRRGKAQKASKLDEVPGIGPARRRELLRRFGSLAGIRNAGEAELAKIKGIGPQLARALLEALGDPDAGKDSPREST